MERKEAFLREKVAARCRRGFGCFSHIFTHSSTHTHTHTHMNDLMKKKKKKEGLWQICEVERERKQCERPLEMKSHTHLHLRFRFDIAATIWCQRLIIQFLGSLLLTSALFLHPSLGSHQQQQAEQKDGSQLKLPAAPIMIRSEAIPYISSLNLSSTCSSHKQS